MTAPRVGDPLAPLERTITLVDMVAYAGATWDWHRLHYDQEFVAASQLPAPLVDGQMFGAYLAAQLMDTFGPTTFVRTMQFRFGSMVFAGETVVVTGEVVAVEHSDEGVEVTVSQRIDADDRVVMQGVSATAVVR